jgi:general stress protein 26
MGDEDQERADRVWGVMRKAGVCMMTTHFPDGLRARPMEPRPDEDEHAIFFLTDKRGLKDDEVKANPEVCLTFIYAKEKVYLSVTGEASITRDEERARALWNENQALWWKGPDDPNLLVLRVEPHRAEIWDGPASSAVAAFEFAKARLTGKKPNIGEKRKATVEMD